MPFANDHTARSSEPTCRVCHNTGRAKMETIDDVSMVAWCRCPAGARALDAELAQRRGGGRSAPLRDAPPPALREPAPAMHEAPPVRWEPPAPARAPVASSAEPPISLRGGGAAPALREPAPAIPLRAVHDHRPAIHVVSRDGYATGNHPVSLVAQLPDAHLLAVGYKADERAGVIHYVTLRIRGERVEVPCDRETADAFADTMSAGKSLRYRISLEPVQD